jgi:hypothetical protein
MGEDTAQFQDGYPPDLMTHFDEDSGTFGGGTFEILELTKALENASIPCCLLGVPALKYYGAERIQFVRSSWRVQQSPFS